MSIVARKYWGLYRSPSDINEHLIILASLAAHCESVFETGVRGVISSYSFAHGLINNGYDEKTLFMNDIDECPINAIMNDTKDTGLSISFIAKNNLELEITRNYDMTFIDTWHVYAQLKRELAKFHKITNKFIVMHDTTVDAVRGESFRMNMDIEKQMKDSGFLREEILKGLWPAVEEFLKEHPEWVLIKRYFNNNGLTILARDKYVNEAKRAIAFLNI